MCMGVKPSTRTWSIGQMTHSWRTWLFLHQHLSTANGSSAVDSPSLSHAGMMSAGSPGRQPLLLWGHEYNVPAVLRRRCFMADLPEFCFSNLTFSAVTQALGARVWSRCLIWGRGLHTRCLHFGKLWVCYGTLSTAKRYFSDRECESVGIENYLEDHLILL